MNNTKPKPWSKKPASVHCDCGRLAYRKKSGEPICQRCDELEKQSAWMRYAAFDLGQLNAAETQRNKRVIVVNFKTDPMPGPMGILIRGARDYAI